MAELARKYAEKTIVFPQQNQQQIVLTKDDVQELIQDAVNAATVKSRKKQRRTDSLYTSDGRKKPTAADPIRTKEDFQKIVTYLAETGEPKYALRNKTIFILGCSTGLRCGDILKLKTDDVYTDTGRVKAHIELFEQKTRKRNICKLPKMAAEALREYMRANNFSVDHDTNLFTSRKGGAIKVRTFYHILNDAGVACGLEEELSTHTMRKTYAMAALQSADGTEEAGNTLQMLQMKLNHSDARITMRYCKAAQDKMDEMSDRVSDWFDDGE